MKKILCVILSCITMLFCFALVSSATEVTTNSQTTAIFKLDGTEFNAGAAKLVFQNKKTKEEYNVELQGAKQWKTEMPLPAGEYEIKSLKTTEGLVSLSLVKAAGKNFRIDNVSYTEIIIPVTEFTHLTTFKDFLLNNFLIILLLVGSGIGLLVVKSKREKGEA